MHGTLNLKALALAVALATLAAGAGNAAAEADKISTDENGWHEGHKCDVGGQHKGHGKWLDRLSLSAEQKKKVDAVRAEREQNMKTVMEQMREEHKKMGKMLGGDASDAQLREQHAKAMALRAKMGEAFFDSMLRIRSVLTPEQRKEFGKLCDEKMGRHGEGRQEQED